MNILHTEAHTRRAFLQRISHLAGAGLSTPLALNLSLIGEAAAFNATDYKALVCVFLQGGNDGANTVVAYDTASHATYAGARSAAGLALTREQLAPTLLKPRTALPEGRSYALHPNMGALAGLFNQGNAAVLLNAGPLVVPLDRIQYQSGNTTKYPLPPKLFSHNDQVSVWQACAAEGATTGWGGRMGDLILSSNGSSVFSCISVSGNSVFLAGNSALQYQCSTSGAIAINGLKDNFFLTSAGREAYSQLLQRSRTHVLEEEYARVVRRSITAESTVTRGLAGVTLKTAFPSTNVGSQLQTVARLIGARSTLGVKRQVFMVTMNGYDTHDAQPSRHPLLMTQLSEALVAFHAATVELGVAPQVTAFTASDFGRTLTINGDGTDHGWGSHHFIVGGAVKGAAFYGSAPPVSLGNTSAPQDQWHVGQGRLLPSTSVDQYAATLGLWFGASEAEMSSVLPNLVRFGNGSDRPGYPINLGFL